MNGDNASTLRALRRAATHPLVRFLAIGAVIFALAPRRDDARHVAIDASTLGALEQAQAARDGVPALSDERRREVDARAIEDEVLYREGLRLALDRNDPLIRQRVIQKLLLLEEDMG